MNLLCRTHEISIVLGLFSSELLRSFLFPRRLIEKIPSQKAARSAEGRLKLPFDELK